MARTDLPPLASIRVFEAAARHGNFTQAADELGLTQAAVSYQVKVLEERVGSPLFHRQARGVALTHKGQALAHQAGLALDRIANAFAQAREIDQATLQLSVIPTFATRFLAQRLGEFQVRHPTIAVRIEISETLVDFPASGCDAAIRSGQGDWPDLVCHKLVETQFSPMLSPALAETIGGVASPRDLLRLPLSSPNDPWWQRWCVEAGLEPQEARDQRSYHGGPQELDALAAIAGRGVAMLTPALFADALRTRQLIQPFDLSCKDGSAYWLVYPHSYRNAPKIKAFRSWLSQAISPLETDQ